MLHTARQRSMHYLRYYLVPAIRVSIRQLANYNMKKNLHWMMTDYSISDRASKNPSLSNAYVTASVRLCTLNLK